MQHVTTEYVAPLVDLSQSKVSTDDFNRHAALRSACWIRGPASGTSLRALTTSPIVSSISFTPKANRIFISFLSGFVEPEQSILLRELLLLELETYLSRETIADRNVYLQRFPGHAHVVNAAFEIVFPGSTPTEPVIENARPQIPNYQILRPIGQGGMGTVYEAIHVNLASPVALKVMHRDLARNLEAEADF